MEDSYKGSQFGLLRHFLHISKVLRLPISGQFSHYIPPKDTKKHWFSSVFRKFNPFTHNVVKWPNIL